MSTTTNIGLFKHDNPSLNTNIFDIDKSLNQNWDKTDEAIGKDRERLDLLEASNTIYNYKGKVDTLANLQLKTKTQGDVWYCEEDSTYYTYTETDWIPVNLNLKLGVIDELKSKTIKCLQEVETPTPISGTSIDINDSAEAKVNELKISGNSKQETRSGKNIFDLKTWFKNVNSNNCTKTLLENGFQLDFEAGADAYIGYIVTNTGTVLSESYRKQVIEVEASKEYTLSLSSTPKCYIGFFDENYGSLGYYKFTENNYNKTTYTFTTPATAKYITIRLGISNENYTTYTFTDIQLEEGTIATEYEQYGASPSPDYSSEIECCGDNIQILKGVEEVTGLTSAGTWANGTWRSAGGGTGTRESIDVPDSPNANIKKGWHTASTSGQVLISQDDVPTTNGQKHVLSCYAKGTGKILLQYGNETLGYQKTNIAISSDWQKVSFEFTSKGTGNAYFGVNDASSDVYVCGMKLEEGNVATGYSDYGQGCINVVICNKNLAKLETTGQYRNYTSGVLSENSNFSSFIAGVKPNTNYIATNAHSNLCYFDKNMNFIAGQAFTNGTTFNTNNMEDVYYITLAVKNENVNTVMVEEGTTATNYEEHKEQVYTIPTQQPFRSNGDVRDTFIKKNNKWYERHWVKRTYVDGTETWIKSSVTSNVSFWGDFTSKICDIDLTTIAENASNSNTTKAQVLCNYFKVTNLKELYANGIAMNVNIEKGYIQVRLGLGLDTGITTVDLLKAKLQELSNAGTPVYVDYVLETPQDIECTEEQSTILWDIEQNAKTYDKVTHIYSTDNVSPVIEVAYKKDIETLFNNTLIEEVG